ncbi:MAG: exodeoxyribonuclease V subunit gamma, partial [Propionibacteriales bacterium]|nr:exodeoxyribonuclease V subunit gamma [Propionibacteriales bacterium]
MGTFHLHRASRSDDLIAGLASLLTADPLDPFVAELVSVPTPGVERWLGQSLASALGVRPGHHDGVAAGIDFRPWGRLMADVVQVASTEVLPSGGRSDPWRPERLVWPVLTALDECAEADWLSPVTAHLRVQAEAGGRRLVTARRIAGLFSRYARERPTMINAWLAGQVCDDAGAELPPSQVWQPKLWQHVRTRIAVPSPAERHTMINSALQERPEAFELPDRLSVFGLNRLDPLDRTVLSGLAAHREVHLWLGHPSPALWDSIAEVPVAEEWPLRGHLVAPPGSHRLVSALGRDLIDFQHVLGHLDTETCQDVIDPAPRSGDSLLRRLQADVAANRQPSSTSPVRLAEDDRSLQVHACHGPDRQVEVLRDVVTGLLADDPTLEPRDIIVMCPDLETFAPLAASVFDSGQLVSAADRAHPGRSLRLRIADQSLHQVNPLLSLVSRLLQFTASRFEASTIVDLCAAPPIATRFGFGHDDVMRIVELVGAAGIRWGLDAAHRDRFGLGAFAQNAVAAGLDRMLLGVSMSEAGHHHVGLTLPLDQVESGDAELVGRLAEVITRLRIVLGAFAGRQSLSAWVDATKGALESLTATSRDDAWQTTHAWTELNSLLEARDGEALAGASVTGGSLARAKETEGATVDDEGPLLDVHDFSALLDEALAGRPTRSNFRTGSLTLSGLAPMRSVPHRVVCLLGMDDRAFPRGHTVDGDDLLAVAPRVGDRDRRSEDRQLFLDALMAAEEKLIIVCSGRDPRTNTVRPPAVPVGDLLDVAATMIGSTELATERLITEHKLQPYDRGNFTATAPLSFDRSALAGARASLGERHLPTPRFSAEALQVTADGDGVDHETASGSQQAGDQVIDLADLIRFFNHPIKALARVRAAYYWPGDEDSSGDEIPIELNGLDLYGIGDRILQQRRAGADEDALRDAEWRRGTLPPRALGGAALSRVFEE